MKINKIKINSYGKLKEKEINFKDGINLIYGQNEAGKSTLIKFITNSLYGISKNKKGKEVSDFDKYKPWSGEEFSGKLEYELDNKEKYEIYRDFSKKNPKIFNENMEDISKEFNINKNKGNEFFYEQTKIDEDLFLSTLAINQSEVKLENQAQNFLIQKIANLAQTGDDSISFKRVIDRINRRQLDEVGTERSREKPINIVARKLQELNAEKENLEKFKNFKYEYEEQENDLKDEILNLVNENNFLNKIKNNKNKLIKKLNIIFILIILINILQFIFIKNNIFKYIFLLTVPTFLIFYIFLINKEKNKIKNNEKIEKNKFNEINLQLINLENEKKLIENNQKNNIEELNKIKNNLNLKNNSEKEKIKNKYLNKIEKNKINIFLDLNNLEKINFEIEKIQNEINNKKLKLHTLNLDKKNIEPQLDNLSKIEEELVNNNEKMLTLQKLNMSMNLAKNILSNSYEKMKNSVTPKFTENLSYNISSITDGKYNKVMFNEEEGLIVELQNGDYIPVNRFSIGTIDQLYLSLRLSMINELSDETVPIFLDEAFAFYDDERLKNILDYLNSKFSNRQIIIFTCTNREKNIFENKNIDYNYIEL